MRRIISSALFFALALALEGAGAGRVLTGVVTDEMCPTGDHSRMRMGPNDAECARACAMEHGASYVLFDGKSAWTLSDQETSAKFAGKRVAVTGTPDDKAKTIRVNSIVSAK